MKIDYHIHSKFSSDSTLDMPTLIAKAINSAYYEIAFTDHFDFLPSEIAKYGTTSYLRYSTAVDIHKKQSPALRVLKGVELGEYHRCHQLVDAVLKSYSAPDLKIASIHVLPEGNNLSEPLNEEITPEMIHTYYQENLSLVKYGNFDILGHLGIYKRYLTKEPDERPVSGIIKEIFALLIEKQIALEINLSGLRNSYGKLIPSPDYLKLFKMMGGELVTIGSDSHKLDHFDNQYEDAVSEILKCGFSQIARKTQQGWSLQDLSR